MRKIHKIILINLFLLAFLVVPIFVVKANTSIPKLQVPVPGISFSPAKPCPDDPNKICYNWIGEYIIAIYSYAIGIIGILATVIMMYGGIRWLTSGGSQEKIGEAKSWIVASLSGLLLVLTSFIILNYVNPALIQPAPIAVQKIDKAPETQEKITQNKIIEKCNEECGNKGWSYENNLCLCEGSGTRRECQMQRNIGMGDEYKCVEVNLPGASTCSTDADCLKKMGCCQCIYRTLGITFNTTCTSGLNLKSPSDCSKHCGMIPNYSFTPEAICDNKKQCIKQ